MSLSVVERLVPFLDETRAQRVRDRISATEDLDEAAQWKLFFEEAIEGRDIVLSRRLRFLGRADLKNLMTEILIDQEHFFENAPERALIIDAGANFGLATYFFKRLYRDCRIIAVEPDPELAALYRSNIERNRYPDVTFLEGALGSSAHETSPVATHSLRALITEPVFLLKLDVEGRAYDVLREARDALPLVGNVVCECHADAGGSTLVGVLSLLEEAGFRTAVRRASSEEAKPSFRFGRTVARERSYLVYASRLSGEPASASAVESEARQRSKAAKGRGRGA